MDLLVEFVYAVGGVVCHQLPERSFFLNDRQLPVCARCAGLYLSGVAGLAGWCGWKVARRWRPVSVAPRTALGAVAVAAMPTAISFAAGVSGIWDGSNATRALLASPLGITAGAVVAAVITKDLR